MRNNQTLFRFVALAVLINVAGFLLASMIDFGKRPTVERTGKVTMHHTGKYSYSQIGDEILRCKPGTFLSKGGPCAGSLRNTEVTATLKSVPALLGQTYVATQIAAGGKVLWEQTDAQLQHAWTYTKAIELNLILFVIGLTLSLRNRQR